MLRQLALTADNRSSLRNIMRRTAGGGLNGAPSPFCTISSYRSMILNQSITSSIGREVKITLLILAEEVDIGRMEAVRDAQRAAITGLVLSVGCARRCRKRDVVQINLISS